MKNVKKPATKAKTTTKATVKPATKAAKPAVKAKPPVKAKASQVKAVAKAVKPVKAATAKSPTQKASSTKEQQLAAKAQQASEAPRAPRTLKEALANPIKSASQMEPDVLLKEQENPVEPSDSERKTLLRKLAQAGNNFDNVYKIAKAMKAKAYKMSESFEVKTPILHKVLGWGFILVSENNRIQVLFKDGVKTLITNYQQK